MFKTTCTAATLALIITTTSVAFAKSSKYERPGSGAPAATATTPADPKAAAAAPSSSPAPTAGGEKKVDLTDLESRYWTAKDTEFNVVQNRLYTKAKRFSVTPLVGTDLSSQYTNDYNFGLGVNYYFSERMGVGIQGWKTSATQANFASTFESQYTASYNYNIPQGFIGANFNWVPIYAKLSFLEKKIFYFDMSINPGIGVTMLQSKSFSIPTAPANSVAQNPLTFCLDVSQQLFINEHWAVKLDIDNHFYQETTYYAGSGTNGSVAGQSVSSKLTYSAIFMLGVTFFQ